MKKMAVFIAICMLLSCMTVFAYDSNMQSVLVSVKDRLGIGDEYPEFTSSAGENNNRTVYSFDWNDNEHFKYLNVSVTQSGIIESIYKSFYGETSVRRGKTIPKISSDDAKQLAVDFNTRINPAVCSEYSFEDSTDLRGDTYYVHAVRIANNIKTADELTVSVNGINGEINMYSLSYTENAVFPSPQKVITADKAENALKNGALEKNYRVFAGEKEARIVYVPTDFDKVDAFSGEKFEYIYTKGPMPENDSMSFSSKQAEGGGGARLSDAELKELENIEGLISFDEAEKRVKSIAEFGVEGLKRENASLGKDSDKYYINLYLKGDMLYAHTTVDAKTGMVLSFRSYGDKKTETEFDDSFITKYYADYAAQTVLKNNRRIRLVNGILFPADRIMARKDKESGRITTFEMRFTDNITFEKNEGIISDDEAYNVLFEKCGPKLKYVWNSGKNEANLIYALDNVWFSGIEGKSGKTLDYSGKVTESGSAITYRYTDVTGHYAENAIKILAEIGIGFEGGLFKPDEIITQKDFLSLLSQSIFEYVIYDGARIDASKTALYGANRLEMKDYKEDEPLSREKAVKYLVKALGNYADAAEIPGIFTTGFYDEAEIDPSLIGYVAVAKGIGAVSGSQGLFSPKTNITRAEAAQMIYNYLKK